MPYSRALQAPLTAYRIGDPLGEHPIWDDGGARALSGRWHAAGDPVIYASERYSTAMLEKLVYLPGRLPPNQHYVELTIPTGVSYEVVNGDALPGWHAKDGRVSRAFGTQWVRERRSAILIVPSVVARMERNLIFNASHDDFSRIEAGLETPVWWDERLFT
ncbi:MAG: RES domain-containing protein [Pseudomonadota bacterium]